MTGKQLEIVFIRAAMTAGLNIFIGKIRDGEDGARVDVDRDLALEWNEQHQQPFALFRYFASDESDGFAGSEREIERFEFLEELLEAAFIRIIQIRLEDVTSEQLLT